MNITGLVGLTNEHKIDVKLFLRLPLLTRLSTQLYPVTTEYVAYNLLLPSVSV